MRNLLKQLIGLSETRQTKGANARLVLGNVFGEQKTPGHVHRQMAKAVQEGPLELDSNFKQVVLKIAP